MIHNVPRTIHKRDVTSLGSCDMSVLVKGQTAGQLTVRGHTITLSRWTSCPAGYWKTDTLSTQVRSVSFLCQAGWRVVDMFVGTHYGTVWAESVHQDDVHTFSNENRNTPIKI